MRDGFRAACRRFLPLSVRRARRIIVTLPHVLRRLAERLRKQAIRRRAGIPHSLLMHPFRPRVEDDYTVNLIACRLGLEFTTAPRKKLAAAMHWHDTTRRPRNPVLEDLALSMPVINLHGNDISKTRVDVAMREVFGYGLAVDPLTTYGPLVEKADANGLHDGQIVVGPLASTTPGRVYQRLIRGRHVAQLVEEIRVPIVGECVPFVYLKYKDPRDPLALSLCGTITEPSAVLEDWEVKALVQFARHMGMDFGELDIMRDVIDDRIYIFDANNTPCVRFVGVSAIDRRATVDRLAEAFDKAFLTQVTHLGA